EPPDPPKPPLSGYADLHLHMFAEEGFGGGWFHGQATGPAELALALCDGGEPGDHARLRRSADDFVVMWERASGERCASSDRAITRTERSPARDPTAPPSSAACGRARPRGSARPWARWRTRGRCAGPRSARSRWCGSRTRYS